MFIDDIISEIKLLWSECRLVRGSPRHSESNGGIERENRTGENKLGAWMKDNNSKRWSIGAKIVQWRFNTQINRSIGNKTAYHLTFGQRPRVGISSLPIDASVLDTLSTEADLNNILDLPANVPLEDAIIPFGNGNTELDTQACNNVTTELKSPVNNST